MSCYRGVHILNNGAEVFLPSDDKILICFTHIFFAIVAFQHIDNVVNFAMNVLVRIKTGFSFDVLWSLVTLQFFTELAILFVAFNLCFGCGSWC